MEIFYDALRYLAREKMVKPIFLRSSLMALILSLINQLLILSNNFPPNKVSSFLDV